MGTVRDVVTVFLRLRDSSKVLLLRRSHEVSSYRGYWAGISGSIEQQDQNALQRARIEVLEETGLREHVDYTVKWAGLPLNAGMNETNEWVWRVHPFLFETMSQKTENIKVDIDWEHSSFGWFPMDSSLFLVNKMVIVPNLLEAWMRVGSFRKETEEQMEFIRADRNLGAAELSLKALHLMRTAEVSEVQQLKILGFSVVNLRPSMKAIASLVTELVYSANHQFSEQSEKSLMEIKSLVAEEMILRESSAFERLIDKAIEEFKSKSFKSLLTISCSGSVKKFLSKGIELGIFNEVRILESRPLNEGAKLAQELASENGLNNCKIILGTDAEASILLKSVDAVVIGADSVLGDGFLINKSGSMPLAACSKYEEVPFYAICQESKFSSANSISFTFESMPPDELGYRFTSSSKSPIILNQYFESIPLSLISGGIITENGILSCNDEQFPKSQLLVNRALQAQYLSSD